jgi:hypothetical protein
LLQPSIEETEALQKKKLPTYQIQQLTVEKTQRLRPEQIRRQTQLLKLSRFSINLTEQTAFAMLESYLWRNFPLQVYQILGVLLKQAISKTWYLERIEGLEPLEKLMLQMYVYAFMEFPLSLNVLGLRVTPLTMFVLKHRPASMYMTYTMLKQEAMNKSLMLSALLRKPELKGVLAGKSKREHVPLKENIGVTEDLTEETVVSTGKDNMGKEWFFTAMRYAYSIPFWIRRRLVRNMGMPESHKYARYFGIGCIPTRYAKYSWKRRIMPEESGILFRRDEWLKFIKRYDKMHNAGKPRKGIFGSGKIW